MNRCDSIHVKEEPQEDSFSMSPENNRGTNRTTGVHITECFSEDATSVGYCVKAKRPGNFTLPGNHGNSNEIVKGDYTDWSMNGRDSIQVKEEPQDHSFAVSPDNDRDYSGGIIETTAVHITKCFPESVMPGMDSTSIKEEPQEISPLPVNHEDAEELITADCLDFTVNRSDTIHVKEEPQDHSFPVSPENHTDYDGGAIETTEVHITECFPESAIAEVDSTFIKEEPQEISPVNNGNDEELITADCSGMDFSSSFFYRNKAVPEDIPSDTESVVSGSDDDFTPRDDEISESGSMSSEVDGEDEDTSTVTNKRPIKWMKKDYSPSLNQFSEFTGVLCDSLFETEVRPVDVFLQLFPEDLIDDMVFQTNLYAVQNATTFPPTNNEEMKAFLAINILMGIKKLPSYRDYWSSMEIMRDPYIANVMSVKRFSSLLSNFHISDNSRAPERGTKDYDKLYKVRPLLNRLSQTFAKCYAPTKYQSVDESVIKFKGRSTLKQYMPQKLIKRGYKVWVRADANGYICQFEIYTGREKDTVPEHGLGERVVRSLSEALQNKHHHVFFDNFFTSVPLLTDLLEKGVYATGAIRANRKFLPELKSDKEMKRGDVDQRVSARGILVAKWKVKRCVTVASNAHGTEVSTVPRKSKDGSTETISCPQMVLDYNSHMGYVDKADMMKSIYEIDRKSRKWWHRIAFHFLDVAIVNAHVLYSQVATNANVTLKDFRTELVAGMLGAQELNKKGTKRKRSEICSFKKQVPADIRYDKVAHLPTHSKSRRCSHCSTRATPRRTRWICRTCDVGLCLQQERNCFIEYHTK
ncbi:piggyBac transposable element-derived protein 3-like isoform X2 [Ornithodoros turicata]